MLPYVDEAERERHERRLERDRRRREQGKQTHFESDATVDSAEQSAMILPPSPDAALLTALEAAALDSEGLATEQAGIAPPALAQETRSRSVASRARA